MEAGAGILPPAGGGWEGGICTNLKQYKYGSTMACPLELLVLLCLSCRHDAA